MATNSAILIPPSAPASSLATTNDIRPIKPPVDVPNPWLWAFWIGGVLLALALLAVVIIVWLAKQKQRAYVPPVPPHVRARQRLDAALLLIADPKAFCIAVSDALRAYLEESFNLRAPERTTEEFLRDLQKTPALNAAQKLSLAAFLEQCDLVKFARFEPPESALRELHESALRLVHETHYIPPPTLDQAVPPPIPPQAPPPPPVSPAKETSQPSA